MKLDTGKGLVVELDPSSLLDLRGVWIDGVNLAPGRAIPDDGDPRIDHSLEGFLFTCGPDHIRHPETIGDGSGRRYPLHGSFAGHAAEISESSDRLCRATAVVTHADGRQSQLQRCWQADPESGEIRLTDRLINIGTEAFPAFLMYHMNIGARLLDAATRLTGAMFDQGGMGWRFGPEPGSVFCVPAASRSGGGGDDPRRARLSLGPIAAIGGRSLSLVFDTGTLPFLQMWRNQQAPADVLGIEPVSHRWVSRSVLAEMGELRSLAPGDSLDTRLSFSIA